MKNLLKTTLLFIVLVLIFTGVFALYHVPAEALLYAGILCICAAACYLIPELFRMKRYRAMFDAAISNPDGISPAMLPCSGYIEKDYRRLVTALCDMRHEILSDSETRRRHITDYYAMWVHQIKTPISAMRLLMSDDERNSALGAELFKIEQYVDMALSYVRMGSDTTDYLFRSYMLDDIVKQAVRKYAPLFITKKIAVDIRATDIKLVTDEKWLQFVIEQILSNSLKYTKKGKISIYASDGSTLVIEDTGIGIAPEDIPRIGEMGFTGYNGRQGRKSTGLGLYMCKEILNRLSHSLHIESEAGSGTKVFLHFSMPASHNDKDIYENQSIAVSGESSGISEDIPTFQN